jgi:hypothetical protein
MAVGRFPRPRSRMALAGQQRTRTPAQTETPELIQPRGLDDMRRQMRYRSYGIGTDVAVPEVADADATGVLVS